MRTNLLDRATGDRAPAQFLETAVVRNSLVPDGCVIAGSVEHSVLSPGVQVAEGAVVRDSVIFHDAVVAREARVARCIVDKDVTIGAASVLGEGDAGVRNRGSRVGLSCGVTLVGIDSQNCPMPLRQKTWQKLASDWKIPKMEQVVSEIVLDELNQRIDMMLAGKHKGRAIVKMVD